MPIVRKPAVTRFGTFMVPLRALFDIHVPKTVVEFGPGYISTDFFLNTGAYLNSVEMCNTEWFLKLKNRYASYPRLNLKMGDAHSYATLGEHFLRADLGFVDGHPDTRPECVNALFGKCEAILAHDIDLDGNHYERVNTPDNYDYHLYKNISPHTGIWVRKGSLHWKIKDVAAITI